MNEAWLILIPFTDKSSKSSYFQWRTASVWELDLYHGTKLTLKIWGNKKNHLKGKSLECMFLLTLVQAINGSWKKYELPHKPHHTTLLFVLSKQLHQTNNFSSIFHIAAIQNMFSYTICTFANTTPLLQAPWSKSMIYDLCVNGFWVKQDWNYAIIIYIDIITSYETCVSWVCYGIHDIPL